MTIASAERDSIFMQRLRILVILTSLGIVGIVAATLIFSSLSNFQYLQVLSHHTSQVMYTGTGFSCVISSGRNFKYTSLCYNNIHFVN